ncbi:Thiolase, N-terminal domain-containing protein [Xylariales sp. AK1849]|nr:Thiolase, N-terminal domain-containing protein [Xylariales sp. AK1849]
MTAPARPNGIVDETDTPSTPPGGLNVSQQSIPSTEGPMSPVESASSFKTELNDDRIPSSQVIPSSLTPPPSSQVPQTNAAAGLPLGYSYRGSMFSPPATTLDTLRRDGPSDKPSEYMPPTSEQMMDASVEEIRTMFQSCLAENARLKMETAHHKLQYNLLSMQADEEGKRAAVEHEMTRREVQVLRMTENSRQARRELSAAAESTQAKYIQLKVWYEAAIEDNDSLRKRAKLAKKVIQQKEDEIISLTDERDMLLNRIRENREHFRMLCSPGGVFHGALTPKTPAVATPQQYRSTPRQNPRTATAVATQYRDYDRNEAGFGLLLQALNHDNNSAPSTPTTANRPAPRIPPKHTRGVQSLSSLPTTPIARQRGDYSALLPSVDLVPQTEPHPRFATSRFAPETPMIKKGGRKSRESTISADDNEELARAALESVAAATQSFMSHGSRGSISASRSQRHDETEMISESQASQAASEMLRRDPRESFDEVASSVGSRDPTPAPAEKSTKLQAKLFAGVNKPGLASEKRKFGGPGEMDDERREVLTSPAKKIRFGPGRAEANHRVGLGIQSNVASLTRFRRRNKVDAVILSSILDFRVTDGSLSLHARFRLLYPTLADQSVVSRERAIIPTRRSFLQATEPPSHSIMALPKGLSSVLAKAPSDIVILSSLRTPICRSYRGQLKDAYPEELLSVVLRATLDANPNLPPEVIEDVAVGVVLSELGGSKGARMAMNHVGFPNSTSLYTVNRACSSSLQSVAAIAAQLRTGMIEGAGIAAGMESMTRNYGSRAIPVNLWPALKDSPSQDAKDCIMPMGLTSENVAERYGVSRKEQDEFAVESHRRAARAQAEGSFEQEIVKVHTRFQEVDKQGNKVGDEQQIEVSKDDGIRANATYEGLAKLKPAFKADGASTAGNSSQVSDGAAATLLLRRSTATELGLTSSILGKFVAATTVGCKPDEMGIGPALAIPKLLNQLGLETTNVDRWEINEAFASQAIYSVRELGLEKAWEEGKVNPDGGAIALGHPLGATGARMTSTLLHGLGRSGGEIGVVSMCVGTGMGMAGLFVRE